MAVDLDPQLLDILACPSDDHAPLMAGTPTDPDADVLTCTECGRRFRVDDGVPVLLLDEAVLPDGADGPDGPDGADRLHDDPANP